VSIRAARLRRVCVHAEAGGADVLDHEQETKVGVWGKTILFGAAVLALAVVVYFVVVALTRPAPEPAPTQPKTTSAPAVPRVEPRNTEPAPEPDAPKATRPRTKKPPVEAPPPAAPAPAGPTLIVESDVPGASVFVNRQYLGTTPLRTTTLAPGSYQLNASADGEDGIAESIQVAETGDTTVTLRFKEVRLSAAIDVVHKHGVGRCEGKLSATPAGLRYETANSKDAFTIGFKDLETFEIDYMKKELKVKQRGGKTWNFTDRNDNADKLFVFHRDVTKAREKLAK
jgi:hypothetical protein